MKRITVVTADIINSKKNTEFLDATIERLKFLKLPSIITPFSVSRGDEIQGVIEGWLKYPEIIRYLRYFCRPLQIRVGIGIGFIEEELIRDDSWKMNGNAFYLARAALEDVEKIKGALTITKTGTNEFDAFINCIWLLIDAVQKKWTVKQWEAVNEYEQSGTYEEASKALGISMQNVEKRCRAAQWKQLKHAEKTLSKAQAYLEKFHPSTG
ncbi:hypothetical protein Psch_00979 [Pelotomaculum schinkii]|uniref:SatD family (SatD) n=1 Tax=Pelotomaculum schinkii TaxID=78350 RepID=A0A4Y7RF48_9FIRM|nr:SatD family protein [Pelotomaculum schinkii]TEB07426.1 hypothetical protein Psch_00979 [Pelotomaculum schinkii]